MHIGKALPANYDARAQTDLMMHRMNAAGNRVVQTNNKQITADARRAIFAEIYHSEVLPHQNTVWQFALRALVRYGRPLSYSPQRLADGMDSLGLSPLSTGFLATEQPTGMGSDEVVPALRISVRNQFFYGDLPAKVLHAVRKAQTTKDALKRAQAEADAVAQLDRDLDWVRIETVVATNSAARAKAVLSPDYARRRERTIPRVSSLRGEEKAISLKLHANPDMECHTVPNRILLGSAALHWMDLGRPGIPTLHIEDSENPAAGMEADATIATTALAHSIALETLLNPLENLEPLRDLPGFRVA